MVRTMSRPNHGYEKVFGGKVNKSAFIYCDFLDPVDGYWHKLNEDEKKWMFKFACEYYFNRLDESDPDNQLHKGDKRKERYNAFNARERCVMTRAQKGTGHYHWYNEFTSIINDMDELQEEEKAMTVLSDRSTNYFDYSKQLKSEAIAKVDNILEEHSFEEATSVILHNCIEELGIEDTAYAQNIIKQCFTQLHAVLRAHNADKRNKRKALKEEKKDSK